MLNIRSLCVMDIMLHCLLWVFVKQVQCENKLTMWTGSVLVMDLLIIIIWMLKALHSCSLYIYTESFSGLYLHWLTTLIASLKPTTPAQRQTHSLSKGDSLAAQETHISLRSWGRQKNRVQREWIMDLPSFVQLSAIVGQNVYFQSKVLEHLHIFNGYSD